MHTGSSADSESPIAAAITVFDTYGYDAASVDQLAEAWGISRSTFFRRYGSKEEVLFADHETLLRTLSDRLAAATGDAVEQVVAGATEVFAHHVALGEVARARFRLVRGVPALRDREILTARRYETLFARHLTEARAFADPDLTLAYAASIVAVNNQALRGWLDGDDSLTESGVRRRLQEIGRRFETAPHSARILVLGIDDNRSVDVIVDRIRGALE